MSKPDDQAADIYDKLGRGASTDIATIHKAILAAKAEEREACAKVAMASIEAGDENHESWLERYDTAISIALKIRKRGGE